MRTMRVCVAHGILDSVFESRISISNGIGKRFRINVCIYVRCRAVVGVPKDFLQHFRGKPFLNRVGGISVTRGVRRFLFYGPGKIRAYSISGISSDFSSAVLKLRKTGFAGRSFRTLLM